VKPLKIFGWAIDHMGCGNYRIGLPMWALNKFGHDALAFTVLNVEIPSDLDILVGQIISTPERSELWHRLATTPGRDFAMVLEIDDDIWNLRPSNPAYAFWKAGAGDIIKDAIRVADAVTVTTEHLAEVVSKYHDNVFVLPNCFDAALLDHERPHAETLTVGWAGGSSHGEDFESAAKDLRTFFRRNPHVDAHFIGVDYGALVSRPDSRFTPWSSNLVDYIKGLDFDIGIAPLLPNQFNRSKSDLKFLEYASLGIPVVASDVGPYNASIQHGLTGLLVRYPHEWVKYLSQMVNETDLRLEIAQNARAWASTRTIQANVWRWEEAYRSVLTGRRGVYVDQLAQIGC